MSAIEPGSLLESNEELRSIGIGSSVCHREEEGLSVLELEVLIIEARAIDALTTSAVTICEVTSLSHEAWDDSVEVRILEVQGLPSISNSLFTCAESAEVFGSLRDCISEETKDDTTSLLAIDLDIEENLAGDLINGLS